MKEKKKYKIKFKNILILSVLIILLVIILYPVTVKLLLRIKGYSKESAEIIYKDKLAKTFLNKDYSKTLDLIVSNNKYDEKYLDRYIKLNYIDNELFIDNLNGLFKNDYTDEQIIKIYGENNKILIDYVKENKVEDIDKYIDVDIFKPERIDRYLKANLEGYKEKVKFVNMDLDKNYFEDPNIVKDYSVTMLVNKHNKLVEDYTPEVVKLTKCSSGEEFLTKEAKEAYDSLCDASIKDGVKLGVTSSYRSFESQTSIYNYYLKNKGQTYVNNYVATPGFSEHQTGLVLDVKATSEETFKYTKEYKWMINNSYKYGFILRYPEGKESITGYNAESWHYRYVGVEIATYIHENDITFEEYYVQFLDK